MGIHSIPSGEEAQLYLVHGALWLFRVLCWGWVDAVCPVNVYLVDSSVREQSFCGCVSVRKEVYVFICPGPSNAPLWAE